MVLCISKAFDGVCHAVLLHMLKDYGVSGKIFGLIQSFLTNRVTKVVLNKHTSSSFHLPGTWMFINDLPDVFSSQLRIYEEYFCHIWPAASTTYLESLD